MLTLNLDWMDFSSSIPCRKRFPKNNLLPVLPAHRVQGNSIQHYQIFNTFEFLRFCLLSHRKLSHLPTFSFFLEQVNRRNLCGYGDFVYYKYSLDYDYGLYHVVFSNLHYLAQPNFGLKEKVERLTPLPTGSSVSSPCSLSSSFSRSSSNQ
jgi:hypothetical protein